MKPIRYQLCWDCGNNTWRGVTLSNNYERALRKAQRLIKKSKYQNLVNLRLLDYDTLTVLIKF